jgi:hypothetical protein
LEDIVITCNIHPAFAVVAMALFMFFVVSLAFDAAGMDIVDEMGRAAGAVKDGAKRTVRNVRNGAGRAVHAVRMWRFDRRLAKDNLARDIERAAFDVLVEEQYAAFVAHWEATRYKTFCPTRYDAQVEVDMFLRLDGSKATDWV